MAQGIRHIALIVQDLRQAEDYYRALFDMELIGREARHEGRWGSLPPDKGWDEAKAAGVELDFVALRRGGFVLALLRGQADPGQVYAIGLDMPLEDQAGVRDRLPAGAEVTEDAPKALAFRDPYGIIWQLSTGSEFQTTGGITGNWLEV